MRRLGKSDLVVSQIGLGTLTFGEQTTEEETFDILDTATKQLGINLLVNDFILIVNSFIFVKKLI